MKRDNAAKSWIGRCNSAAHVARRTRCAYRLNFSMIAASSGSSAMSSPLMKDLIAACCWLPCRPACCHWTLLPRFGASAGAYGWDRRVPSASRSLVERAKKNASQPYKAPPQRAAEIIRRLDFDAAQKIKFRPDHALWPGRPVPGVIFSSQPLLQRAGRAAYSRQRQRRAKSSTVPDYFDYGGTGLDQSRWPIWAFRAFGSWTGRAKPATGWPSRAPAISAPADRTPSMAHRPAALRSTRRGATAEEFPRFSEFWLDSNGPVDQRLCPAGRALDHRRLQIRRHARITGTRQRGDECALRFVLPCRYFAAGRRAAHQHVLVWRE